MNHDLPASLREALHRVDALAPMAPSDPPAWPRPMTRAPLHRHVVLAVAAIACLALAAAVLLSTPWNDDSVEARYAVVETSEGTAMFLPAVVPAGYELVAAQRVDADPDERGATILTGRIDGETITEWTSASTSPLGLAKWFDDEDLDEYTTSMRSYRAIAIDDELVVDFVTESCGAVTVTTAATDVFDTLAAGDRIDCDDGSLIAQLASGHELLYTGPRNTAPDDGLVLTYDSSSQPTVQLHLRRVGYPPALSDLTYDGEADRPTIGDKQVTITTTDDTSAIAWSFEPDNLIVVSSPDADATSVLSGFIDQLAPAAAGEIDRLCDSVGATDCT